MDGEIEKLLMATELDIHLKTEGIKTCKRTARTMIDSGKFTVEEMIKRIKNLHAD